MPYFTKNGKEKLTRGFFNNRKPAVKKASSLLYIRNPSLPKTGLYLLLQQCRLSDLGVLFHRFFRSNSRTLWSKIRVTLPGFAPDFFLYLWFHFSF